MKQVARNHHWPSTPRRCSRSNTSALHNRRPSGRLFIGQAMKKTPRQFRISRALDDQVQRVAASINVSRSAAIRILLAEALKGRGMWPASGEFRVHSAGSTAGCTHQRAIHRA